MKFGNVDNAELSQIDLTLPEDHADTNSFLEKSGRKRKAEAKVYVGCAKWGRAEWVGQIYPEKTKEKEFLDHYVQHFNSIELNATFYRTRKDHVAGWAEKATDGFKFCPKFTRLISHFKRLKGAEEVTDYYIEAVQNFGNHLGLCFLQMPENFGPKRFDELSAYMEYLPTDFPVAVELRHKDWFSDPVVSDETFAMIRENNKSIVITDTAGRRDMIHQRLTNDSIFIRFIGYDLDPTDYSRMDQWIDRIISWIDGGLKEVYFFVHQGDETHSPPIADYMIKALNKKGGLNIKGPKFINR